MEADNGEGRLAQLGAELHPQRDLILVELAVLVQEAELDRDLDHVGDDLVSLLVVFKLPPQDEVYGVQENTHLVVDELLGHGLV